MPTKSKTRRIRRMRSIKDVRRKHVTRMPSKNQSNSLFDYGYWMNLYFKYTNELAYSPPIFVQRIKNILRFKGDRLQKYIERDVANIAKSKDFNLLRAVLSFWVGPKGMIDAPRKALIETGLYDWAAAVEEGRGTTTNWETVIELYARSKAEYHLKRLKREMPKRAEIDGVWNKKSMEELVKLIDSYLRDLAAEKKAAKKGNV